MEHLNYALTAQTNIELQREALQMILLFIATILPAAFDEATLEDLDPCVYYTENNGFSYTNEETGSFYVRHKNGKWMMQVGLTKKGSVIAVISRGEGKIQYQLGSFYQTDPDHIALSPFKGGRREFLRFRKSLACFNNRQPIGRMIV